MILVIHRSTRLVRAIFTSLLRTIEVPSMVSKINHLAARKLPIACFMSAVNEHTQCHGDLLHDGESGDSSQVPARDVCVVTRGFHNTQHSPAGTLVTWFPGTAIKSGSRTTLFSMRKTNRQGAKAVTLAGVAALELFRLATQLKALLFQRTRRGEEFEGQASSYERQDTKRDIYHGCHRARSMPAKGA